MIAELVRPHNRGCAIGSRPRRLPEVSRGVEREEKCTHGKRDPRDPSGSGRSAKRSSRCCRASLHDVASILGCTSSNGLQKLNVERCCRLSHTHTHTPRMTHTTTHDPHHHARHTPPHTTRTHTERDMCSKASPGACTVCRRARWRCRERGAAAKAEAVRTSAQRHY